MTEKLRLIRYQDAAEFARRVEPFLVKHEAENNLPLGLIATVHEFTDSPYLASVESDGEVVAVGLRTPPRGLVLSAVQETGAVALIAQDVFEAFGTLPDVSGPNPSPGLFAGCWQLLSGQAYRLDIAMRIYCLEGVCPVAGVPGEARLATAQDYDLLWDWFYGFQNEALGETDSSQVDATVQRWLASATRTLLLWCDEGRPVSLAGSNGPTPHGIRIGPVYTPPANRNRGYASACVADLSQRMLDAGYRYCFLFTDLGNPTSNKIYQNVGYEPVCDVDKYRFEA